MSRTTRDRRDRSCRFERLEDRLALDGQSVFIPPPAPITPTNPVQTVRVIVLNFEPTVPSQGNQTLWQIFHWSDPRQLAAGYISDMEAASGGAVHFQIVQWRDVNEFPIFTDGFRYTADQYVQNRTSNTGWDNSTADFYTIAKQQHLADLVNNNVIDEIWTFGDHYFNLFGESWMAGPQSFFINGPTFPDFPVDRAVAGYGFSYERGVAEMLHNNGHRTENHMSRAYGGWNIANPTTPWDKFTANVGQTNRTVFGVGNTHFPFNGTADYDYSNTTTLDSYADDFVANFPNQSYVTEPLSRDAWGDLGTGDWQRGYLDWFFGHLPRGTGTTADGRQNNWYKYIYDFNSYRPTTGLPRDNEAILGAAPLTVAGASTYQFTLRYYDLQGIDTSTLDKADVLVTGPGGFSQMATLADIGPQQSTTAGTARTVRYQITAPGGIWDPPDSGVYTVSLRTSQVRDTTGAFLPAATLGGFSVSIVAAQADAALPTAVLTSVMPAVGNQSSTSFVVHYSDDTAVDIRSINFGDVRVTGPNGFAQTAAFYGLDVNASGPARDATYFVSPPGGTWDHDDNGTYTIEVLAQEVSDRAGKFIQPQVLGSFVVNVAPPEARPRADLTELNAKDWYAWAALATASTTDDTMVKTTGAGSVRFDTNGGFDTYLRYEPANGAAWDLTAADQFYFSVRAQNPSPFGFQAEPVVRFIDLDGNVMEFHYYHNGSPYPLWNDALGTWLSQSIPIKSTAQPATGWRGTAIGTPDWSRMRTVEIHADTWDSGFTLWFDRVGFNLPAGDFNLDARLDAADVPAMLRALANLKAYQSDNKLADYDLLAVGDVSGDGFVRNDDLQALLNLLKSSGGTSGGSAVSITTVPSASPAAQRVGQQSGANLTIEMAIGEYGNARRLRAERRAIGTGHSVGSNTKHFERHTAWRQPADGGFASDSIAASQIEFGVHGDRSGSACFVNSTQSASARRVPGNTGRCGRSIRQLAVMSRRSA